MKHVITTMYTKKALSASLKKLMETKPFSKITVRELIADCGLNRKTFYYHFQDMRDLLRWTLRQEAIDVVKSFDLAVDYEAAILFIIDYLEQNQHMLNCVYDSIGRDELKLYLYDDFAEVGKMIIATAEKQVGKELSAEYKSLLVTFYTDGIIGIVIEWLHGGIKLDKNTAVRYVADFFKYSLSAIVAKE